MGVAAVTVVKRPARLSSAVGVLAAAVALAVMVDVGAAHLALGVELVGLLVAGLGAAAVARGARVAGTAVALVGAAVALAAVPYGVATAGSVSVTLALLPGLVGVFVLAMAVLPVRGGGSRGLVRLGAGLAFVGVIAAALLRLAPPGRLLAGAMLVVVAWDAGDYAIGVGEQLGSRAATRRLEFVHLAATATVGLVALLAARVVGGLATTGLPLESFVLLLVAAVLLTLSLHG